MFNDISISKIGVSKQNNSTTSAQQKAEDTSIFGNNIVDDKKPVKLTKEEKQAKKEAEKAEKKRIKNTPDGIIQGGAQGRTAGDCWLLAQMNSMAQTEWGKEAFKNAITKEDDGSFTVHFKGINKDIKISQKEFEKAQKDSYYSNGDADALLLELATEKHFKETGLNNGTIKGNSLAGEDSLQFLMTGVKGREFTKKQKNYEQQVEMVLMAMAEDPEGNNGFSTTYISKDNSPDSTGDISHAVSVKGVIKNDKGKIKEVVILDSYKPNEPFTKSYGQFINEMEVFGFTRVTKKDE